MDQQRAPEPSSGGPHGAVTYVERTGGVLVEVPARPEYLSLVRMLVRSLAQRRDLDDERVEDVTLAVSEAVSNAIEAHAGAPGDRGEAQPVAVRWSESPESLVFEIVDRGSEIDVGALPDETVLADPSRAALEGDLSVPLIRALVDEVAIESDRGGTSVIITVRCGPYGGPDLAVYE